jgi:molybdopterin molybdotransferase
MHSVAEAEKIIGAHLATLPAEDCSLALAHGRILRVAVAADRDFPPFDRVTMDGFAVAHAAIAAGITAFRVIGTQAAGMIPLRISDSDSCVEIATGAVLPHGADCVVPYEMVRRTGDMITLAGAEGLKAGANIHRRGSDCTAGTVLIQPGTRLSAREIAVAASCGAAALRVSVIPRVAVVSTGDELVEVDASAVGPHQVRRSNDHTLRAALLEAGFSRVERFHFRDVEHEIFAGVRQILSEFDVVLLTGGVSKGKFDYLPCVLNQLRVEKKLHGVAQRPGKPFWFGVAPRGTPVFALPGNPVSTYTCFRRYVLPALLQMSGAPVEKPSFVRIKSEVTFKAPLTLLLPVKLEHDATGACAAVPLPTNTSGDFAALVGTDGFVELPSERDVFPAGFAARFWRW